MDKPKIKLMPINADSPISKAELELNFKSLLVAIPYDKMIMMLEVKNKIK